MTFPTREDNLEQISEGYWVGSTWVPAVFKTTSESDAAFHSIEQKPRLDWLLLLALTLDLGLWVGLLAWWIWR